MNNPLIILDLDNTLTKSSVEHQTAFKSALANLGISSINTNWEEYEHLTDSYIFKFNYEKTFDKPFDNSLIPELDQLIYNHIHKSESISQVAGAENLIHFLNQQNIKFCLATGSLLKPALYKIQKSGLDFGINQEQVFTCNHHYSREGFIKEAIEVSTKKYDSDFDNIISIGDGIWDYKTAKNLDLHFAGIGDENKNYFLSTNVNYIFKDWTEFDFDLMMESFLI